MERLTDYHVGENCAYMKCSKNCCGVLCENCEELEKIINRLAAYEDTWLEPEEYKRYADAIKKLNIEHMHDLLQAENDGRLAVLPCKVGDIVHEANKRGFISTYKVISIHFSFCSTLIGWELMDGVYSNLNGFEAAALGKTVFLTREEAEAALKKREEADHEQNQN